MSFSNTLSSRRMFLGLIGGAMVARALPAYAGESPQITIYKDPNCGCCTAWAAHMREAGFLTKVVETRNLPAIKPQLGVPSNLTSCHTAVVAGYVVEGHVPASAVLRLLEQNPEAAAGLAVPGMPAGSPGMEGGVPEDYQVVLFGSQGQRVFARFNGHREI